MPDTARRYTVDEVLAFPSDGNRYELVDGELLVTGDWRDCQTLFLAIEVVSPSSARGDRFKKRRLYQRRGVATYWVVDPDAQIVEVWHPQDERPEIVTDVIRWRVNAEAPEFGINLPALFAQLPG